MPRPYNTCDSEQEVLAAAGEVTQTNGSRHAATVQHLRLLAEVLAAAGEVTQNQWVAACRDRTTPATPSRSTCRSGRSYANRWGAACYDRTTLASSAPSRFAPFTLSANHSNHTFIIMSDGNYNRNLLPYRQYQSGLKAGRAQMHTLAIRAFRQWLTEQGYTEAQLHEAELHYRQLLEEITPQ